MPVRKINQGNIPRGGETHMDLSQIADAMKALSPIHPLPGLDKEGTGRLQGGSRTVPKGDKQSSHSKKQTSSKERKQPHDVVRPRMEDANIFKSSERYAAEAGSGGLPRGRNTGIGQRKGGKASPDVIGNLVRDHLQSRGQTPGPQLNDTENQSLSFLRDQGMLPGVGGGAMAGGMHEPTQLGAGKQLPEGLAAGGGNPLAPFLMQMLNPRMSPGSPQGAVPTLQGAPQGFSLYNMLRLLSMFKQLYGGLPVGGQSLPAGVGGAGGMEGGF